MSLLLAKGGRRPHRGRMDRAAHRSWLEALAAEDRRRRAEAMPVIAHKEGLLREARARLQASETAVVEIESALAEERAGQDEPGDG